MLSKTGSFLFFYFTYILQLYLVATAITICYTIFKRDIIMGKKDKLIAKLKSNPKDFTFEEAESLLGYLSFHKTNKGKTSGSRFMFTSDKYNIKIILHKPHPRKELLSYQVKLLIDQLEQEELI